MNLLHVAPGYMNKRVGIELRGCRSSGLLSYISCRYCVRTRRNADHEFLLTEPAGSSGTYGIYLKPRLDDLYPTNAPMIVCQVNACYTPGLCDKCTLSDMLVNCWRDLCDPVPMTCMFDGSM
jgi:hypothetical protein